MHDYIPDAGEVTVLSAPWCGHCTRLKGQLGRYDIPYREVRIDEDPEAERIAVEANGGSWLIPTVLLPDGRALVNPSIATLRAALGETAG